MSAGSLLANKISGSNAAAKKYSAGILGALILGIIPESIGYNFPLNDRAIVTPYLSPLQFEFIREKRADPGNIFAGGGIGCRMHFLTKNEALRLSPHVEYKIHYAQPTHYGISAGISCYVRINSGPLGFYYDDK